MIHDNMLGANNHQNETRDEFNIGSNNNTPIDFQYDPDTSVTMENSLYDCNTRDVNPDEADLAKIPSSDLLQFDVIEQTDMFFRNEAGGLTLIPSFTPEFVENIATVQETFPILEEHDAGGLNFELHLGPSGVTGNLNQKNSWYHSTHLKRVYIKLDKTFYIEAVHSPLNPPENLFIRAMMVFTDDIVSPVQRCPNHICSDKEPDTNSTKKYNVIRSDNTHVQYTGIKNGRNSNERLSVIIRLSPSKPDINNLIKHQIALNFVCQNSCLNRKATSVIFTLEDAKSRVLGKKIVNVKVCSCPKRDMEKDEEKFIELKRPAREMDPSTGKRPAKYIKIKEEPDVPSNSEVLSSQESGGTSSPEITLSITMPDIPLMRGLIDDAYNRIAGQMAKNPGDSDKYRKYLKTFKKTLDHLNGSKN